MIEFSPGSLRLLLRPLLADAAEAVCGDLERFAAFLLELEQA